MARTATATLQTIWDCRWSRPGYLPRGLEEPGWPDSLWVCVRPTGGVVRRPVTEAECEHCPHWQKWEEDDDDCRH